MWNVANLFTTCTLTTSVRRQSVLAGARGSRAACRSHTLIFLEGVGQGERERVRERCTNDTALKWHFALRIHVKK